MNAPEIRYQIDETKEAAPSGRLTDDEIFDLGSKLGTIDFARAIEDTMQDRVELLTDAVDRLQVENKAVDGLLEVNRKLHRTNERLEKALKEEMEREYR